MAAPLYTLSVMCRSMRDCAVSARRLLFSIAQNRAPFDPTNCLADRRGAPSGYSTDYPHAKESLLMVAAEVALARFANATSKTEMTMDEAASLSHALARDVRNYLRDHDLGVPAGVIGIATGGLMVAKIVAADLNVPLEPIFIRRRGSRLKRALGKLPFVVNLAAAVLRVDPIRERLVPLLNRMNRLESKGVADAPKGSPLAERKPGPVVLIDDCVESGNTILQAIDQLRSAGREVLATGVLAVSATALTNQQREQLGPLVSLLPRLHRFPWSQDNPAYAEFLNWLQTHQTRGW